MKKRAVVHAWKNFSKFHFMSFVETGGARAQTALGKHPCYRRRRFSTWIDHNANNVVLIQKSNNHKMRNMNEMKWIWCRVGYERVSIIGSSQLPWQNDLKFMFQFFRSFPFLSSRWPSKSISSAWFSPSICLTVNSKNTTLDFSTWKPAFWKYFSGLHASPCIHLTISSSTHEVMGKNNYY